MSYERQRIISALSFAIVWTAGMLWWFADQGIAHAVVLAVGGVLTGLAWYWIYGRLWRNSN